MPQAAPSAPPPSAAPAAAGKPKGAIGIWIGVLVIIGGIVLGIVLVVAGVRTLVNGYGDLQRVPINGGGVVRIEESGTQKIYAERRGTFNSNNASFTPSPNVAVRVIGPGQSGDVAVNTGGSGETYNYDGREGVKIGTFYAATPGTYRIVTQPQDNSGWSEIAVGNALDASAFGAILGGVFGGGLVVLIGIVVVVIFAVRRSRSKKRLMPASPYPSAYGAAAGGWPAAPGYAPPGAPGGYGAPPASGGYGAPAAPGGWPASTDNPGWAAPPVVQPSAPNPGPTWNPPQTPPPQAPAADGTWPAPPAPGPAPAASPWQPVTPPPDAPASPPADPLAPSWDPPPSSDAPPPPPPSSPGEGGTPS